VTILYLDTSALLKRVVHERESNALRAMLGEANAAGHLLSSSSVAWVEVWRSLRRDRVAGLKAAAERALAGIAEFPLDTTVLQRARLVGTDELRSLDAIHLAAAITLGAHGMVTYDRRLALASASVGLEVLSPGRSSR
jgi:uncharacterized protein